MKQILSVVICLLLVTAFASCSGSSNSEKRNPMYTCVLYEDNNGELRNESGERVCAVAVYSRGEPLLLHFSSEVDWNGIDLKHLFLKNGNVYTDYPSSSKKNEIVPIATYNMSSNGAEMSFEFFPISDREQIKKMVDAQKKEKEDAEKQRIQMVEKTSFNTADQIRNNINGTIWTHTEPLSGNNQFWYRLNFKNGKVYFNRTYPRNGKWESENESSYNYTIEEDRYTDTGEKYNYINFGQFRFIPNTRTLIIYYPSGAEYYKMKMNDYNWD